MSTIFMHSPFPNKPAPKFGCNSNRRAKELSFADSFRGRRHCIRRCNAAEPMTSRRSGNYQPSVWDFNYIESLTSENTEKRHWERAAMLIEQVKKLLEEEKEVVGQLELVDDLQRLGISYHFQDKINQILNSIYYKNSEQRDLYLTARRFRLLRQHGFKVSQEVFSCFFRNENGDFKSMYGGNTKGLLQLYEASFLLTQGEETLEIAREISSILLQKKLDDDGGDGSGGVIDEQYILLLTRYALEVPIHWRTERPDARWFIDVYKKKPNLNPIVLELAKLDFNIVQATHQQELKHVSRWWKQTGLAEKLPFARDRLVECYFWTIGVLFEPKYERLRIMSTKVNVLITIIDDIFDVYATLEELRLFKNTIQRWDIEAIDQLPDYMQICFLALNNFINEMAYDVLKEQGVLIIPHLRKSWADLFGTYMLEAEWYSTGYTPTLKEYIENAWISISAPVILSHTFFLITNPVEKEVVDSLYKYHNIVRCSGMLLRLANDLGTSPYEMQRGDVPKSVECYMNEKGCSREEAREYVRKMLRETWKDMNKERVGDSPLFSEEFMRSAVDLGRMALYMYQHGDGHGIQNPHIKHRISALLFEPIM